MYESGVRHTLHGGAEQAVCVGRVCISGTQTNFVANLEYCAQIFLRYNKELFFQLRIRSDVAQRMYSMPLARHGRPGRSLHSPRHVAPVLLVVYWLRRAIKRFMSNTGSKYRIPAASHEAMCAYLRQTVYACLPGIRNSVQWRTHSSPYTRALWGLVDDNVLIAWSQDVKYSSPAATLQQLVEQRHQMLASVAYARLVRVTARELMRELFEHNLLMTHLVQKHVFVVSSVFFVCCPLPFEGTHCALYVIYSLLFCNRGDMATVLRCCML